MVVVPGAAGEAPRFGFGTGVGAGAGEIGAVVVEANRAGASGEAGAAEEAGGGMEERTPVVVATNFSFSFGGTTPAAVI